MTSQSQFGLVWSNYINSFCFILFSSFWVDLLALRYQSIWTIRSNPEQLLISSLLLHAFEERRQRFVDFLLQCDLHHHGTALSHALLSFIELLSITMQWLILSLKLRFVNLDDMTSWSFLIIAALAGLLRQRHFQTCYDHYQNTSYFDILSKAAIQTKFPNALLEVLQACFFISLLSVPISTDSMAVARCLIRLDLIDIYHRLI